MPNFDDIMQKLKGFIPGLDLNSMGDVQANAANLLPTNSTQASGLGQLDIDTVEKLAKEDAKKVVLPASNPQVPNPNQFHAATIDPVEFQKLINLFSSSIVTSIVNSWSKSVKEMSEAELDAEKKRIRMGLDRLFSAAAVLLGKENNVAGVGAMAVLASAYASEQPGQPLSVSQAVLDALPVNLQPLLAMVMGVISVALSTPVLQSLFNPVNAKMGKVDDTALAVPFAFQTLALVTVGETGESEVGQFISSALPDDTPNLAEVINKVQIQLLINALALFYSKATGWVTEEELLDTMDRGALYAASPQAKILVDEIRKGLATLAKGDRDSFLHGALQAASDNPATTELQGMYAQMKQFWVDLDAEAISQRVA